MARWQRELAGRARQAPSPNPSQPEPAPRAGWNPGLSGSLAEVSVRASPPVPLGACQCGRAPGLRLPVDSSFRVNLKLMESYFDQPTL